VPICFISFWETTPPPPYFFFQKKPYRHRFPTSPAPPRLGRFGPEDPPSAFTLVRCPTIFFFPVVFTPSDRAEFFSSPRLSRRPCLPLGLVFETGPSNFVFSSPFHLNRFRGIRRFRPPRFRTAVPFFYSGEQRIAEVGAPFSPAGGRQRLSFTAFFFQSKEAAFSRATHPLCMFPGTDGSSLPPPPARCRPSVFLYDPNPMLGLVRIEFHLLVDRVFLFHPPLPRVETIFDPSVPKRHHSAKLLIRRGD